MTPAPQEPPTDRPAAPSRRTVLAALGALPVLAAAAAPLPAAAATVATATATATVLIDPAVRRQSIRGFGGMNHPLWAGDLTAAQRETAFGNGPGQLGFTVLRIHVDEDRANWSREVATAKRAAELGAIVFATPWNPPAALVETFVRGSQTDARRLRHDQYGAYAQHLEDFRVFMADNGVELYAVSVQNEPDYAQDWTWWTSDEIVRFLRENAGAIGTRVIAPESFQYVKGLSDPVLNDPVALANLDVLGAHLYGTPYANFPYPLFQQKGQGKELWMTEVYYPNSSDSADLWPQALGVGEHMHHALVDGGFQAYVWWYIRRSYGPMREDGQLSKRGAVMAHFAKFVRPGHVRLDAPANPQANVWTSAYQGGSAVTVVAVNQGTAAVSQQFALAGTAASAVSAWVTDATRTLTAQAGPALAGGSFTATLPAQSVTTFVVSTSVGPEPMPPTAPGTPVVEAVTAASATLSWAPSTDDTGVARYDVVRVDAAGETVVASTTTTRVTVTGLAAGTGYAFAVYAFDPPGNRSPRSATVAVTTPAAPAGGCGVDYRVTNSWDGGFQGEIVLRNTGTTALTGWTLSFAFTAGQVVNQLWGGTATQSGGAVSVTPADYTRTIPAGGSVTLGFIATQGATNPAPAAFALNGAACGGS
ncbi:cellulose binding domain-containing protein [Kitasatospora sp. YST-16]|uniref:cellulose binding domain-containing protein n=1 Tax=Kitasatospora sp. YST-16 TaxID=2998080 RepID=UPI00228430C7|nr:cellulose binding domain-containing protein [Kitasatospora sp. YST-16]WAL70390.1 cellulose binding domain-containing protein [Kitasatospora sp. YST-16]WNW36431.1 cellulose binding domain-containing protein [Streptomyces sp. Li-HN-5-13]